MTDKELRELAARAKDELAQIRSKNTGEEFDRLVGELASHKIELRRLGTGASDFQIKLPLGDKISGITLNDAGKILDSLK